MLNGVYKAYRGLKDLDLQHLQIPLGVFECLLALLTLWNFQSRTPSPGLVISHVHIRRWTQVTALTELQTDAWLMPLSTALSCSPPGSFSKLRFFLIPSFLSKPLPVLSLYSFCRSFVCPCLRSKQTGIYSLEFKEKGKSAPSAALFCLLYCLWTGSSLNPLLDLVLDIRQNRK